MAKQNLENGATFGVQRQKINENFTEVYERIQDNTEVLDNKVDKDGSKVLSDVNFTSEKDLKLSNIESNATLNEQDSYLLDRINHTGYQDISTITGLQEEIDSKLNSSENIPIEIIPDISASKVIETNSRYFITQEMFNFITQLMVASNNNE